MAENVELLLLGDDDGAGGWILGVFAEQIWEGLQHEVSDGDVIVLLLPLVEIVGIVHWNVVTWLNEICVHIREYPDGILPHISDMLVAERLIYFPEEFIIVFLYSVQQLLLLVFLHLRKNFVG